MQKRTTFTIKQSIGSVLQHFCLVKSLTAEENSPPVFTIIIDGDVDMIFCFILSTFWFYIYFSIFSYLDSCITFAPKKRCFLA